VIFVPFAGKIFAASGRCGISIVAQRISRQNASLPSSPSLASTPSSRPSPMLLNADLVIKTQIGRCLRSASGSGWSKIPAGSFSPTVRDIVGHSCGLNALPDARWKCARLRRLRSQNGRGYTGTSMTVLPQRISGGSTFVPMMESAELRDCNDFAGGGWLRTALVKREMRSRLVRHSRFLSKDSTKFSRPPCPDHRRWHA
jgi:hypothetical protein